MNSTPATMPYTATIRRSSNPLAARIGPDTVLFDTEQDSYFSMNTVGSRIWELLEEPKTLGQLIESIQATHAVTGRDCEEGVRAFLTQLRANHLIETC